MIKEKEQSLAMTVDRPVVLSFAATDPTSGAGLQADLLTLVALGCHPLGVVTAVTVQDTLGVEDILPLDANWVADQARSVLEDMPVAAFKIGVMGSPDAVAAIAEIVSDYPDIPLVLDPVLASGRGDAFADETLLDVMRDLLLPQTTLITPNSMEARRLASEEYDELDETALADCATRLIDLGCEYALVTGSHEQTADVRNVLYGRLGPLQTLHWERLPGSYHGSGCTLASAIAGFLARGFDLESASQAGQHYTYETLRAAYRPGMGQFIPDRLFWVQGTEADAGES